MTLMALSATAAPRPPWRPSILDGYILRMLALPALAVLGVTLVAFLLEQTLRLIDQLAANGAHMGYLVGLVGNMIPYQLGLALPAAFFVAMFMVIGRLGEESQIDAFLAGGVSFDRLLAPLVFAGLLLGVLNLLLMGYLQPYSRFGYRAVLNAATEAGWTARLDPQVFINAGPQFTISADEADPTGRELTGVFISRKSDGGEQVVTATRGVLGLARDQKTTELRLEGGLILSQAGETPRLLRFGRLTDRELIKGGAALRPRGGNEQELTFPELVSEAQRPDALIPRRVLEAELLARLARSLAIPLLPFIALPLAMASKRGSRTAGMIVGAVILVAYHHSVTLAKSFSDEGVISPFLSIGAVFLAITVFSLWLFFSSRTRPGDTPLSSLLRAIDALIERRPKTAAKVSAKVAAKGPLSLSAYLTRMMAVRTLGAGVALIALLQLIDLLGETSQILEHGGVLDIGRYMLLRAPSMVQEVAPFAVLAGA
ncbi:MAG: LptF/LptG family permease, partial [Alphaproteobacteria bacterium]|nr:LptF/LptG family permease [Alphaproteobacteria bacterium]